MSTLAIVHPTGLLGQELREGIDARPATWTDIRLLASDELEVGTLTEVGGAAAMVNKLEPDSLRGVDVAFLCGGAESSREILPQLDPSTLAILLGEGAGDEDAPVAVHGVNSQELSESADRVWRSPHPGVVLLAHLLAPLRHTGLVSASATLSMPASRADSEGLDELFEQTRAIIALVDQRPQEIFGRQLAFSQYPDETVPAALAQQLRAVLGPTPKVSARTIQAGVFHGVSASVHLQFDEDPGSAALQDALSESSFLELRDDEEPPSPIDSAAREEILVDHFRSDGQGGYWVWAVMDNLTRGGALNALGLAEAALRRS